MAQTSRPMSGTSYETLSVSRDGHVLHLRLNRPEVRNAFDGRVVRELAQAVRAAEGDAAVRVVLLSGEGRSFCAGADLGWMGEQAALSAEDNERGAAEMARLFLTIAHCAKPVVAKVHGHALGGGTGLVAAADIAIAARDTRFGLTEVKLGIVPAVISPFVLQKIGVRHARALFLTGERFDAVEAERIGLIRRAVPAAELDAAVQAVLDQLASSGPRAMGNAKELIRAVAGLSLEDAVPVTARWIAELRATPEAREGMAAFLEKRPPSWNT